MAAQEGTIADVGTKEQVLFDFAEVARPLALIEADHPLIGDLTKWGVTLLAFIVYEQERAMIAALARVRAI